MLLRTKSLVPPTRARQPGGVFICSGVIFTQSDQLNKRLKKTKGRFQTKGTYMLGPTQYEEQQMGVGCHHVVRN